MCKRRGILTDMEDLNPHSILAPEGSISRLPVAVPAIRSPVEGARRGSGILWLNPATIDELTTRLLVLAPLGPVVCAGFTSAGIYHDLFHHKVFVSLAGVAELQQCSIGRDGIQIGAAITMAECITTLQRHADQVCHNLWAKHFSIPILNVGFRS